MLKPIEINGLSFGDYLRTPEGAKKLADSVLEMQARALIPRTTYPRFGAFGERSHRANLLRLLAKRAS